MKTTRILLLALGAAVAASSFCALKVQAADQSTTVVTPLNKDARAPQLAPALEEIVKLTKAGVAEPVTLAFIQSSPTAYSPDAQDILRLQEQGVSPQVMTAMIQHGEELRRAAAEATKQNQPTTTATSPTYQIPAPVTVAPATTSIPYVPEPSYPASSVSVTYIGFPSYTYAPGYYGPYGYWGYGGGCYPNYYSYARRNYGYGYCGSRVGFGVSYGGVHYGGYSRGYYGGYGRCR